MQRCLSISFCSIESRRQPLALACHLLLNREQIFKILLSSFFSHSYWCYFKSLQLSADVAIFLVLGSTRLKSAAKLLLFFDIRKDF